MRAFSWTGLCRVSQHRSQAVAVMPHSATACSGYEEPPRTRSVVSEETFLQLQSIVCYPLQWAFWP